MNAQALTPIIDRSSNISEFFRSFVINVVNLFSIADILTIFLNNQRSILLFTKIKKNAINTQRYQ